MCLKLFSQLYVAEPVAPKPFDSTRSAGHTGVYQDIQQIWSNCSTFMGADSDLAATGRQLHILFDAFYSHRVLGSLSRKPEARSGQQSLLNALNTYEYPSLPYCHKLDILDWLVEEAMGTALFRAHIEEIADVRHKAAKIRRSSMSGNSVFLHLLLICNLNFYSSLPSLQRKPQPLVSYL